MASKSEYCTNVCGPYYVKTILGISTDVHYIDYVIKDGIYYLVVDKTQLIPESTFCQCEKNPQLALDYERNLKIEDFKQNPNYKIFQAIAKKIGCTAEDFLQ